MSADNKPLLGPEYLTDIGSLSLENEDDEEIVLAGFLIMELTTTMKENRTFHRRLIPIPRNQMINVNSLSPTNRRTNRTT
jgi:hypothetical protein